VGSLLLHALLLGVAARRSHVMAPSPSLATSADELELDVTPPLEPREREAPQSERAPSAPVAERAAARPGERARVAVLAEPNADEPTPTDAPESGPGEDAAAPAASPSSAAPHLSLSQLGVDGANPFLDRSAPDAAARRTARAARVKRRLDQNLAQGTLAQDTAAGRGSASPVLRALEGAVYASNVPLTAQATFSFVIDSSGSVISSTLGEAQGDRTAWLRVAHQAARSLDGRKLTVPRGKSVRLTVAVSSRLELPSGADPGVEVDVLGIPVKKGAGKRSTRVDILNPLNPLAPLTLLGDPADIGSRARRMVNAHVISEELL
jgi:hypothetical protein